MNRFLSKPKDFEFSELRTLLAGFGYIKKVLGKTSGSRVGFVNMENGCIIRLHKPHPSNTLKMYQIEQIIDHLKQKELI